ncbi:HlyD family efflux transporter periplasmic adaptor subunit [bacterium]|nr:HlyD family efflux transporter periplasmic adaptor subunit [bacterium]
MRWLTSLAILLLLGSGLAAFLWQTNRLQSEEAEVPAVEKREATTEIIAGIGYVEPVGEVRRLGFKIDGRVSVCNAPVGSVVKAGDLILQLDDSEERAAIELAATEVHAAEARLQELLAGSHPNELDAAEYRLQQAQHAADYAEREHRRLKSLLDTKSTSNTEADRAQSMAKQSAAAVEAAKAELTRLKNTPRPEERVVAQANVATAEATLLQAKARLEQTRLLAPFDGAVLEVYKREGDVVRAIDPEPAILFADITKLRVRAEVDERFVDALKVGVSADVYGRPLGDRVFKGTVTSIKQIMGPKTVFSRAAAERVDLDVVQLFIDMPAEFKAPVGLRVDVRIFME